MKAIWLVAAIGACAALSSCDQSPQQTAETAPAAPPPACACRPTAPQETAAATQTVAPAVHRRHHYWRSEHRDYAWNERRGDYSRTDFSESVLAPYDYVSQSSVSETSYSYNQAESGYDTRYRGRVAYRGGDTIPASMTGRRLDPWAGYGVRCPWM